MLGFGLSQNEIMENRGASSLNFLANVDTPDSELNEKNVPQRKK